MPRTNYDRQDLLDLQEVLNGMDDGLGRITLAQEIQSCIDATDMGDKDPRLTTCMRAQAQSLEYEAQQYRLIARVLDVPLDQVPVYLNNENDCVRGLAAWRLKNGH